ncbi:MAG: porin [Phycisphaerales bacterium]
MTKIALMLLAGATVSTAALADNTAMSRDEVRSMVSEMLSDAQTRSSLLQGGGMAGYDGGFVIGSADGNWKVKMNGLIQFRYIADFRDDDDASVDDDFVNGFQLRKARITFSGNAVNPNLTYFIAFETNNSRQNSSTTTDVDGDGDPTTGPQVTVPGNGGDWIANDVWFAYNLGDGWKIRGGQYKVGWLKEELLSEKNTLAMERGVMNQFFSQGRSQGVGFVYESNDWKWSFDYTDGFNSANTDINNPNEAEYALSGRGEFKWAGDWKQLEDYTSKPGDANAGSVGFAAAWQRIGSEPAAGNTFWGLTGDVQWEGNGWSVFAAAVWTNTEVNGAGNSDFNDWGFTAQVGYRWSETSELFAKVDGLILDGDRIPANSDDNKYWITFGYNHYFAGQAAKFTVDCIWALNDSAGLAQVQPGGNSGLGTNYGLVGQADSGEFALRAQFQLAF